MIDLTRTREIRKRIFAFLAGAAKAGAFEDGLALAAQIGAMVAAGGANPVAAMAALETLGKLSQDLDEAEKAADTPA